MSDPSPCQLDHIGFVVSDIDRAQSWWREHTGAEALCETFFAANGSSAVFLATDGLEVELIAPAEPVVAPYTLDRDDVGYWLLTIGGATGASMNAASNGLELHAGRDVAPTLTVIVSDCADSTAWYARRFGLTSVTSTSLQLGDALLELRQQALGGRPYSLKPGNLGAAHLCLAVDDVAEKYRELTDAGVKISVPLTTIELGYARGREMFFARDPDGLAIQVIGRREES